MNKVIKVRPITLRLFNIGNMRQVSPLDDLYIERVPSLIKGHEDAVKFTSDIHLLCNQKRLDKMSEKALVDYLNSYTQYNDQLRDMKARLTDKQLAQFVKSRYIQSISELTSWSDYICSTYEKGSAELQNTVAQIKEFTQLQQPAAPAPAPAPAPAKTE